jgi:hypothetical protein
MPSTAIKSVPPPVLQRDFSRGRTFDESIARLKRPLMHRLLLLLVGLVILKVTASIVSNYRDYFPPNFNSEFLRSRESYFFGAYQYAFYTHILTGPITLVVGLILISDSFRRAFSIQHRYLGRLQVACVLLFVAPSGFFMAFHAAAGPIAGIGLLTLAILTGTCAAMGARSAMRRRFQEHRRWMWRCFLLLCSAVVLRLMGGLAAVTGFTPAWLDPLATWASWLVPLGTFELVNRATIPLPPHGRYPRSRSGPDAPGRSWWL